MTLVVRSSGGREDLAATFAGQYETFLGVAPEEVPERWRQVVASQFGERAMIYFKIQGLLLEEAAMGVLIQRLVAAKSAGVMFTTTPESCDPDRLPVSATWGLAADLVGGRVSADEYVVSKADRQPAGPGPYEPQGTPASTSGRAAWSGMPVAPELVAAPALEEGDLASWPSYARALEAHCGCPHGVEWVKDAEGRLLLVIQSRHLQPADSRAARASGRWREPVAGVRVLLEAGHIGSPGVAAGPVFHLPRGRQPVRGAAGVVLVAPRTTPRAGPGAAPGGGPASPRWVPPPGTWPWWPGNTASRPWWTP